MSADHRPRTGTIRWRITATATLVLVSVLVVTGFALVAAQRRLLTEDLDDGLRERANVLARLDRAGELPEEITGQGDDDAGAQVVDRSGRVIASTRNLAGSPPVASRPPTQGTVLRTTHDIPIDEHAFRLLSRRQDGPNGVVFIHVMSNMDDIDESAAVLRTSLAIAVPAVGALLALLTWWLVGRTLRPVEAIRADVAAIGAGDLHRRVPEPATDDEIGRLARTMNAMLERIERSAQCQQQFVADASHELRSPLARIRAELEVDLAHPEAADAWATHRSALEETVALEQLVDDLLHLARSDAHAFASTGDLVDLGDVVVWQADRAQRAPVVVDCASVEAVHVRGDERQLARAIGNLVDNAVRYATSRVTISLTDGDGTARLVIDDDGPGIPTDDRERVFERFGRLDDARAASTGGTGLGLAIAREIVERHGGTLDVGMDEGPGTRLVLVLPLPPASRQGD